MKNLTLEQNIRTIVNNSTALYNNNGGQYYDWVQSILMLLQSVVCDIRFPITDKKHLYGLTSRQSVVSSDYGDAHKVIVADDIPFNSLEDIRDELINKLMGGYEIYVYGIHRVEIVSFNTLSLEIRYYMSYKCIHRTEWPMLIREHEQNRVLMGERSQWLNRWIDLGDSLNFNDYTTKKPDDCSLVNGKIKKFKFLK